MATDRLLKFELVPLSKIRKPVGKPADEEIGSAYDPILRALEKHLERAAKIVAENSKPLRELPPKDRERIRTGILTIATNRGVSIETQIQDGSLYAWLKSGA
ncbi:MAG: hypothetical protein LC130_15095 [Bryobacterales bacterium]|nr:hypothetical protein [Bryobacterales bacterium]MEB2363891.1 hypothetical protein [Bryobacterales bacterium]